MEKKIVYEELYTLQDLILKLLFLLDNSFYLTGGTALHRFYLGLRYSDDLDFFTSKDSLFAENIDEFLNEIEKSDLHYNRIVQSKDFQRIIVDDTLQLDFVNDHSFRYGKSVVKSDYKIDNIINILSNKLSAIADRDEEKDIFDLFAIAKNQQFNWDEVLSIVNKKTMVQTEFITERIASFPLDWLKNIKKIKDFEIDAALIQKLIDDIVGKKENSLFIGLKTP